MRRHLILTAFALLATLASIARAQEPPPSPTRYIIRDYALDDGGQLLLITPPAQPTEVSIFVNDPVRNLSEDFQVDVDYYISYFGFYGLVTQYIGATVPDGIPVYINIVEISYYYGHTEYVSLLIGETSWNGERSVPQ